MALGVVALDGDALGYETIAPTSAKGITASIRKPTSGIFKGIEARTALISVEAQICRFRMDGGTVTATTGHTIPAGGSYVIRGVTAIANLSLIDSGAGASTVRVTTFG